MKSMLRFTWCAVAGAMALAAAVGADNAQSPGAVKDQAGLFKPETIKKANEAIEDLNKKGIRLAIETYPTVPKESIDDVKKMDAKARDKFYLDWALGRVKDLGKNTILILATNEPKHLETASGPEAIMKFPRKDREALTNAMLQKLRKMQVDDALLEAVATLRKHFEIAPK